MNKMVNEAVPHDDTAIFHPHCGVDTQIITDTGHVPWTKIKRETSPDSVLDKFTV